MKPIEFIDKNIGRSCFEMLPARITKDNEFRQAYGCGVKESDEAWHEILKEIKKELIQNAKERIAELEAKIKDCGTVTETLPIVGRIQEIKEQWGLE